MLTLGLESLVMPIDGFDRLLARCVVGVAASRLGLPLVPVLASAGARVPPRRLSGKPVSGVVTVFCVVAFPWPPFWCQSPAMAVACASAPPLPTRCVTLVIRHRRRISAGCCDTSSPVTLVGAASLTALTPRLVVTGRR